MPASSSRTCSSVSPTGNRPAGLVANVAATLGVSAAVADEIIVAFERHVAEPLQQNLSGLDAYKLAKRNPMIYTARGATSVDEWVGRRLDDWETSAIEGHLGTWQEEVARIVSRGLKPGSGVDLQLDRSGVIELYAVQSAPNTKSSGGRRSDVNALRAGAAAIRASKRPVEMFIAVLSGRSKSRPAQSGTPMSSFLRRTSSGSASAASATSEHACSRQPSCSRVSLRRARFQRSHVFAPRRLPCLAIRAVTSIWTSSQIHRRALVAGAHKSRSNRCHC